MSVMRDGRSTLMAMLEAFLYDPLLSWTVSLSHESSTLTVSRPPSRPQRNKTK